jgi:hypothetical protein
MDKYVWFDDPVKIKNQSLALQGFDGSVGVDGLEPPTLCL